jgi:hypothetical protein
MRSVEWHHVLMCTNLLIQRNTDQPFRTPSAESTPVAVSPPVTTPCLIGRSRPGERVRGDQPSAAWHHHLDGDMVR